MITLTLTPEPDLSAVHVEVAGAVGVLTLTRSDDNGEAPVRLMPGQVPIGGSLLVTDYDAALTGTLTYTASDDSGPVSASTVLGGDVPVLHVPVHPQYRQDLLSVLEYRADRDSAAAVHWIIDRTDPVVVGAPARTRTGTMVILTEGYAAAQAVDDVATQGEVVMFREPVHGLDMYATITRTSLAPERDRTSPRRWTVTVDYVAVRNPSGGLLGSVGWTIADVATDYATIADVAAAFVTVRELVIGP